MATTDEGRLKVWQKLAEKMAKFANFSGQEGWSRERSKVKVESLVALAQSLREMVSETMGLVELIVAEIGTSPEHKAWLRGLAVDAHRLGDEEELKWDVAYCEFLEKICVPRARIAGKFGVSRPTLYEKMDKAGLLKKGDDEKEPPTPRW